MQTELAIFVCSNIMLRSNVDVTKGLVNIAISFIIEIIWPNFQGDQMYDIDLSSARKDFSDAVIGDAVGNAFW